MTTEAVPEENDVQSVSLLKKVEELRQLIETIEGLRGGGVLNGGPGSGYASYTYSDHGGLFGSLSLFSWLSETEISRIHGKIDRALYDVSASAKEELAKLGISASTFPIMGPLDEI